jgi:uncharacterized protein YeaO (DUF488 family)
MTIKTKCIYEPREESDGRRVLITRYYPRGVKKDRFDDWVRPLSPTRELLAAYRKGAIGWDEFATAFVREMRGSDESREAIRALHEAGSSGAYNGQVVTLLCFERAHLPCHRHIVREVVDDPSVLEGAPRLWTSFGD